MYWSLVLDFYQDLFFLLLFQEKKKCFISPVGNQVVSVCNHREAHTRLVLRASYVYSDVFVVCEVTDVFILMIWAYSKLNVRNNWYLKYDQEKVSDIRKNFRTWGKHYLLVYRKYTP